MAGGAAGKAGECGGGRAGLRVGMEEGGDESGLPGRVVQEVSRPLLAGSCRCCFEFRWKGDLS